MHTPGPWDYSLEKKDATWPGMYSLRTSILAYGRDGEEGIYIDNPDDAHLMFAAPELLEALKEVVAISDRKHDAWDKAHAAIAKAEGRNPS